MRRYGLTVGIPLLLSHRPVVDARFGVMPFTSKLLLAASGDDTALPPCRAASRTGDRLCG
jgi:hypothetical protein